MKARIGGKVVDQKRGTSMNAAIFIQGRAFKTTQPTAEECLGVLHFMIKASVGVEHTFTFQPATGFIFSNPGTADTPCGILFKEGYKP